ncbi:MAG: 2-oxoacid:acceptor oxidoreductase subunit alpha [Chromatiaceae bacterium]|nr:MAG: 2-oxoacid:acceptor oxidoreductase subunit alpha [Chromatiaceae bacterium]
MVPPVVALVFSDVAGIASTSVGRTGARDGIRPGASPIPRPSVQTNSELADRPHTRRDPLPIRHERPLALAVTGSGGNGALTAGMILLAAVARAGLYGLLTRSAGPQIRGGESAAMLRFGPEPLACIGDRIDLLLALDWANHLRFSEELPLARTSLVLADPAAGTLPPVIAASGAALHPIALRAAARRYCDGRTNMVAVGVVGAVAGLPLAALLQGAAESLAPKGEAIVTAATACIRAGFAVVHGEATVTAAEASCPPAALARWNISGNEAAGLGALRGGVRFVAAYPITPASDLLEWLAPRLPRLGGLLIQAEDELAAINMVIGSSFGGVPALTATSGPGLSLMSEGLGLAVASETPIVVANVMRGGPSTGIPTKSEQADLDLALYGLHGDAPHLVLAPLDIADCAFTFDWATRLTERLQVPAIVLSDQALGQARAICDPPPAAPALAGRERAVPGAGGYARYAASIDGVSPMAVPGEPGHMYTAEGLEHNARGTPSSMAADHCRQLDKRWHKLVAHNYGPTWADIDGCLDSHPAALLTGAAPGGLCLITWGSSRGAVVEAAERLRRDGWLVRVIALRLLAPLQQAALRAAIAGAGAVLVVELNHRGQLFRYLHAQEVLPTTARVLAHPGPLPLRPAEIIAAVQALEDAPVA